MPNIFSQKKIVKRSTTITCCKWLSYQFSSKNFLEYFFDDYKWKIMSLINFICFNICIYNLQNKIEFHFYFFQQLFDIDFRSLDARLLHWKHEECWNNQILDTYDLLEGNNFLFASRSCFAVVWSNGIVCHKFVKFYNFRYR